VSKKSAAEVFRHVRMRARERYGVELPEHVWRSWCDHFNSAPTLRHPTKPNWTVRVFRFHGLDFYALTKGHRVMTVLPPGDFKAVTT